jgi:hypothetical protein
MRVGLEKIPVKPKLYAVGVVPHTGPEFEIELRAASPEAAYHQALMVLPWREWGRLEVKVLGYWRTR